MQQLINKNLEEIKHNNTDKSYTQIIDTMDMNAIYFCVWLEMLLKDDPDWFKHNSVSSTYILFKAWQLKDPNDVE
jgi:hypothetical protein